VKAWFSGVMVGEASVWVARSPETTAADFSADSYGDAGGGYSSDAHSEPG
jgi:hypothetical protein